MGITWSSRAHVFPQLDDAGSTLDQPTTFRQGLGCESICDPPGGKGCAVGSREPRNLYTNCPLLSRPTVNHRSG